MTYEEVYEKLTGKGFFSRFAGLYRMGKIMDHFGNPEKKVPCIHVAGTNGKGSCCAMLHQILSEAGYKIGLFTSPYIHDFRERIQINGEMIPKEDLTRLAEQVFSYTDRMYEPPNQFELLTIIAFLYFAEQTCDVMILETGLGGTYDQTNIVPSPLVSVIMNIGYDHVAILGNQIEQIASAKAGIIKPKCDVVLYPSEKRAMDVLTAVANKQKAPIHYVDPDELKALSPVEGMEHFSYKGLPITLSLLGEHQRKNCAAALEVIRILNQRDYYISDADIIQALSHVYWPGRMECLQKKPYVYLDGGHNPQCMEAALKYVKNRTGRLYVLCGMLKDKDYETMLSMLKAEADEIHFVKISHPRAFSEEEYQELCKNQALIPVMQLADTLKALLAKMQENDILLCTGSLYLVDSVQEAFRSITSED